MALTLLAYCPELDEITKDAIGWETRIGAGGQQTKIPLEARFPYFADGFVNADQPRDSAYTVDIQRAVKGWALSDESGRILGKYKTVAAAENARQKAVLKLEVEVEDDDEDEDSDE